MDEELKVRPEKKNKINIVTGIICAFLLYYAVMSALSPVWKIREMRDESDAAAVDKKINPAVYTDSAYLSLLKMKSFMQSKNLMARTDSIYLVINLQDSTSDIEISGVTVHSAKISSFDLSAMLRKDDRSMIPCMLSMPLTIGRSVASIRKEPVMVKIAPKDTSEYKPDLIPDTSVVEPVNYVLEMAGGTRIYVYQEEDETPSDIISNLFFDLKYRLRNTWSVLKSIALLKVPEYHPFIKIRIPREDGKIIYRALPAGGQVAVFT